MSLSDTLASVYEQLLAAAELTSATTAPLQQLALLVGSVRQLEERNVALQRTEDRYMSLAEQLRFALTMRPAPVPAPAVVTSPARDADGLTLLCGVAGRGISLAGTSSIGTSSIETSSIGTSSDAAALLGVIGNREVVVGFGTGTTVRAGAVAFKRARVSTESIPMQIPKPVSTMLKQGLGAVDYKNEVGAWKPAFLDIGWPELSKFLELSSFTEDEKKDLKEHRRRKKNRSYAKTSRAKKKTDGGPAGTGVYSSGNE